MDKNKLQTTITQEVPEWKLKLAYFYTENKIFIKRAGLFLFFFVDLIILFSLGAIWVNYKTGLIKDRNYVSQMAVSLVNKQALQKTKPQNLYFEEPIIIPSGHNKYDLMVKVVNNNDEWAIKNIEYTFIVNGQKLKSQKTFILPKSEKYLMYFNVDNVQQAQLKILNTNWERIKDFSLLSYKDQIKSTKNDFKAGDTNKYFGTSIIEIYNDSPFDYWEVGAAIILYNKSMKPLAIDYITINKLLSKETRKIEINWQTTLKERIYKTQVYPEVNLLNENTIMQLNSRTDSPSGRD